MAGSSENADRYRRISGAFTARVEAVPAAAWDAPAPPEGWVARDVVRHLVEWIPGFFTGSGLDLPDGSSLVDDDPAAAWRQLDHALQAALDDPAVSEHQFEMRGDMLRIGDAVDQFCTGDVLVHTWDLARATGQDETLDAEEVHRQYEGMLPYDEALRASGHFGPAVPVPDDADEQTKLIAFLGRTP
jgi:uncharacterized protein (TIGR03086 family)